MKIRTGDVFVDGFLKLGLLMMTLFLIGQLKIEFLRFVLIDYAHFIFIVFAVWLALADMARTGSLRRKERSSEVAGMDGQYVSPVA